MRLQNLITTIVLASLIYQPFYTISAQESAQPSLDVSAPEIQHEEFTGHQPTGQQLEFIVKAVDDSGIEHVTLYYRVIGTNEFKQLEMVKIGDRGIYSTIIPPEDVSAPGIEYYIESADTAGNTVLRGFDFDPLIILVGSAGFEETVTEPPVVETAAQPKEQKKKSGAMKWVLIGLGVAAVAGLGIALGGGGGGDGGGGPPAPSTGSVTVVAPFPEP